jgi:hypothetical protein
MALGALMFLLPHSAISIWSWPLTPLTAQVLGSWFVASGLVLAAAMWENDRWRLLAPASAFIALVPVQFIAMARFGSEIDWGKPQIWLHTVFLAGVFVLGLIGIAMSLRSRSPVSAEPPPASRAVFSA